jgi:hypothetical protein
MGLADRAGADPTTTPVLFESAGFAQRRRYLHPYEGDPVSVEASRYANTTEAHPNLAQHPSNGVLYVALPCFEGRAGQEDAILAPRAPQVCIVGPHAFLDLCKYDEGNPATTTTVTSHAHVDADSLLNALVMQMFVERVRLAIPYV